MGNATSASQPPSALLPNERRASHVHGPVAAGPAWDSATHVANDATAHPGLPPQAEPRGSSAGRPAGATASTTADPQRLGKPMRVAVGTGTRASRGRRTSLVETIKVHIVPPESREAAEAALGRLMEEWAALTYSCLVAAAVASHAENEPMQPAETTSAVAVAEQGA
jgi:hypothetical protein